MSFDDIQKKCDKLTAVPVECVNIFLPIIVAYDNSNGGTFSGSVTPGTMSTAGGTTYTFTSWIVDGNNVLPNPITLGPWPSGGAGYTQQLTDIGEMLSKYDPCSLTWFYKLAYLPEYHYRHLRAIVPCNKQLPEYGALTSTRGSNEREYTQYLGNRPVELLGCYDRIILKDLCDKEEEYECLYLVNKKVKTLAEIIEDSGIDLDALGLKIEDVCVQNCVKPLPEIKDPVVFCETTHTPYCGSFDDPKLEDICVELEQTVCRNIETGEEEIFKTLYTQDSYLAYLASNPADFDLLVEIEESINIEICDSCGDCEIVGVRKACDAVTCEKVDFLIIDCNGTISESGPFYEGTDLEYEGSGSYIECTDKNIISSTCKKALLVQYTWDNGAFSDPFTGIPLVRPGTNNGSVGTNGYLSVYETPFGTAIPNGDPNTYVGVIDRQLACGTATINNIMIDGVNVLPAPVVETTTTGTWGALNNLVWAEISSATGFTFPSQRICHNNRPAIKPVNCAGKSEACVDINLESFEVTDCKGTVWTFLFKKVVLEEKELLEIVYQDCNGNYQCEWIDPKTKEVLKNIDRDCLVDCQPLADLLESVIMECPDCGQELGTTETFSYVNSDNTTDINMGIGDVDNDGDTDDSKWNISGDDGSQEISDFIKACLDAGNTVDISYTTVDGGSGSGVVTPDDVIATGNNWVFSGTFSGDSGKVRTMQASCKSLNSDTEKHKCLRVHDACVTALLEDIKDELIEEPCSDFITETLYGLDPSTITGQLHNREWDLGTRGELSDGIAVYTDIRENFDFSAPTTVDGDWGSVAVNDTNNTSTTRDAQIIEGKWIVTAPMKIRWAGGSYGYFALEFGRCCGSYELVLEGVTSAGTANPTPEFNLPVGIHAVRMWNIDDFTNTARSFQYSIDGGVTWITDNTPPNIQISRSEPHEFCKLVKICKDTEIVTDFFTGLPVDISSCYTCPLKCTPSFSSNNSSGDGSMSVEIKNTHLIEGCIKDNIAAFTIVGDDGKPLFDPIPLTELGFNEDCCQ